MPPTVPRYRGGGRAFGPGVRDRQAAETMNRSRDEPDGQAYRQRDDRYTAPAISTTTPGAPMTNAATILPARARVNQAGPRPAQLAALG